VKQLFALQLQARERTVRATERPLRDVLLITVMGQHEHICRTVFLKAKVPGRFDSQFRAEGNENRSRYESIYLFSLRNNSFNNNNNNNNNNNKSVALVGERTITTERPPLVEEASANFCG
jgi:hypothetical protein